MFWRVTYVLQVVVLSVLTVVTWGWQRWVGVFFLCCLVGSLIPLGAVWSTWRERREAARLGLARPE